MAAFSAPRFMCSTRTTITRFSQELRLSLVSTQPPTVHVTRPCSALHHTIQYRHKSKLQCNCPAFLLPCFRLYDRHDRPSTHEPIAACSRVKAKRFHDTVYIPVRHMCSQPPPGPDKEAVITRKGISIRNPFFILKDRIYSWLIRVYFDPEFSLDEFAHGAKQAIHIISHEFSQGAFENLDDLISTEILTEMRRYYKNLGTQDKKKFARDLAIHSDGMVSSYPHLVRVHYDDTDEETKVVKIKIQMTCISLEKDIRGTSSGIVRSIRCDYEFHRDFSPGVEAQWIVTGIRYPSFNMF